MSLFSNAARVFALFTRRGSMTMLVAALGYFVDVFDLILFSIVRVESLKDLGLQGQELTDVGVFLINMQMGGMLLGGLLWGVWGDKLGRLSVLLGSILLYSLANLANGFVTNVDQYAVLRFVAGFGLAGELGAGVTLASELVPRLFRGLGTTFIATIGVAGALFAVLVVEFTDWRTAYIVGGLMGLALLVLRLKVTESRMYLSLAQDLKNVSRGDVTLFLRRPDLLWRLVRVAMVGTPTWAVLGVLITFTPEFARDMGMSVIPDTGFSVLFFYTGIVVGGAVCGILSQALRSRRHALLIFLVYLSLSIVLYVLYAGHSPETYYTFCLLMGLGTGIWSMFIQMGAEQFGTNIRATAASCTPNFARGMTIPMTLGFQALSPLIGVSMSGVGMAMLSILIAGLCVISLRETFGVSLDYVESD